MNFKHSVLQTLWILVFILGIFPYLLGCSGKINLSLDETLQALIAAEKQGKEAAYALQFQLNVADGNVEVTIEPVLSKLDKAISEIERYGTIINISESKSREIAAFVPINRLETLAVKDSILFISAPGVPNLLDNNE